MKTGLFHTEHPKEKCVPESGDVRVLVIFPKLGCSQVHSCTFFHQKISKINAHLTCRTNFWLVGEGERGHALRIVIIISKERTCVGLIKTGLTTGILYTHGICGSHIYIIYTGHLMLDLFKSHLCEFLTICLIS